MSASDRLKVSRRAVITGIATQSLFSTAGLFESAFAAAPMLGVKRPHVYRFKLGAFEVTNILDGIVVRAGPHPIFGENLPEDAVRDFARTHHLPVTRFENPYTVTLVNTEKNLILFDTGNGDRRRDQKGGAATQPTGCGRLHARTNRHRSNYSRSSRPYRRFDGKRAAVISKCALCLWRS